ncbi:MAG TPA: hypothetical protein VFN27_16945 [Xanthobacteraceae bacterium]|nr:hypothetical protein [Xanthobacteraceae bacterium]
MALTTFQPTLPATPPFPAMPADASLQFCSAQTITATGYLNNTNTNVAVGAGRTGGFYVLSLSALSGTTPSFQFHAFGSNDSAFGNGNVEDLMEFDFAVTGSRLVATIIGASIAVPDAGRAGGFIIKPVWNFGQGEITYQFLRLYCVVAGTTPSLTVTAWFAPWEMYYG